MTNAQAKPRVFISFDYDNDVDLKNALVGQARYDSSPFEIADWSLKEAQPANNWQAKARERIRRVDKVIVPCGEHTDTASGVSAEVRIAREEGKPVYFIRGRPDKACKLPKAARPEDRILQWTWTNLAQIVNSPVRSSEPLPWRPERWLPSPQIQPQFRAPRFRAPRYPAPRYPAPRFR